MKGLIFKNWLLTLMVVSVVLERDTPVCFLTYVVGSRYRRASQVSLVVENPSANAGRYKKCRFDLWIRNIPWRRKWQPTLIFLSGESHGQRSLAGYIAHRVAQSWTQLK